jgi:hypothetical protein
MGWTVYSFSRKHTSFKDPDEFRDDDGDWKLDLREKLKSGHAFVLSYFEHSGCVWSLQGQGPECRWDSVHTAGIMIYDEAECGPMGAETLEDRAKDAAGFLETYTCWCNGEVYGYQIEDVSHCKECGHEIVKEDPDGSCWGFYGNDIEYMASEVRAALGGDTDVTIAGDADWLADHHDFGQKKATKKEKVA